MPFLWPLCARRRQIMDKLCRPGNEQRANASVVSASLYSWLLPTLSHFLRPPPPRSTHSIPKTTHSPPPPSICMRCRLFGFWLWLCGLAIFKSQEVSARLATGNTIPCAPLYMYTYIYVCLCVRVCVCWWPLPVVCRHFHNVCLWPVGVCWFSFAFYFSHQ